LTDKAGLTFTSSTPTAEELERAVEDLSSALEERIKRSKTPQAA
jgi:hypothetical protein